MATPSTDTQRVEQARHFIEVLLLRMAAYHQHKESAAYAGITLFAGIAGAAAISEVWPPKWGPYTTELSILASTLLWFAVLAFLRFQLTRRRWAALRVAGCDRLLAAWLQVPPTDDALAAQPSAPRSPVAICERLVNWLCGSKAAVRVVDTTEAVYPSALVNEWLAQEERGTDALIHERLILLSGWALYILLIAASFARHFPDVPV